MLSRFHLIPECHGLTDRIAISLSRVSVLTRDKNQFTGSLHEGSQISDVVSAIIQAEIFVEG